MSAPILTVFIDILGSRTDAAAADWLRIETARPFDGNAFARAYAGAGRRLGRAVIVTTEAERMRLEAAIPFSTPFSWTMDELGRAALLLAAFDSLPPAEHEKLADDVYFRGDNRERRALLSTLVFLPSPDHYLPLAVEACRTSVLTVFEGIACENAYPVKYFPEPNFNQLALKALFLGVDLDRVFDWRSRNNETLFRMADDYANERRAAGRSVPDGNRLIIEHFRSLP